MSDGDDVRQDHFHARTSARVEGMSDEARAEIARSLAGRRALIANPGAGGGPDAVEAEVAAEVARVRAELHRTERRLDRIERSAGGARFQKSMSSAPSGRYARLLSRADRLERRLRALR